MPDKVETVGDAYIAARAEVPLTASCLPLAVVRFGLAVVQATHTWSVGKDPVVFKDDFYFDLGFPPPVFKATLKTSIWFHRMRAGIGPKYY